MTCYLQQTGDEKPQDSEESISTSVGEHGGENRHSHIENVCRDVEVPAREKHEREEIHTDSKEKIRNKEGVSGSLLSSDSLTLLLSRTLSTVLNHIQTHLLSMTRPNSSVASLL